MENMIDDTVIVDFAGRLFASAFFSKEGAVRARFVSEFPDCGTFTRAEAMRIAKRLRDCGFAIKVIAHYGYADETVIAVFQRKS